LAAGLCLWGAYNAPQTSSWIKGRAPDRGKIENGEGRDREVKEGKKRKKRELRENRRSERFLPRLK